MNNSELWHLGILGSLGEDPEPPEPGLIFIAICLATVFVGTLVLSLLGVI